MDTILLISILVAIILVPAFMTVEIDEFAGKFYKRMTHT